MAYATATDVANRLGRELDTDETILVESRLGDAELIIKRRIPDLDDRVAADEEFEKLLIMIECEMILRLVRNPEGYTQETDGNYSYTISRAVASGKLEVLSEEWGYLGIRTQVGTVKPTFDPYPYCGESDYLLPYTWEQALRDGWA